MEMMSHWNVVSCIVGYERPVTCSLSFMSWLSRRVASGGKDWLLFLLLTAGCVNKTVANPEISPNAEHRHGKISF